MIREELARELQGHGVEFGPGCNPLAMGPSVESVKYCDRLDRKTFLHCFPEAQRDIEDFPDPIDYRVDFGRSRFADTIGKEALDFVIANHVLEHLVNPIRFLEQCYQCLKPGGVLYLALPDKRNIFDRDRSRTPLSDLVARYQADAGEVSEEQVLDFINGLEKPRPRLTRSAPDFPRLLALHRERSIHVNVWLIDDIVELFQYLARELEIPFQMLDGGVTAHEFVLLFRKTSQRDTVNMYTYVFARIYAEAAVRATHVAGSWRLRERMARLNRKWKKLVWRVAAVALG